MLRGQTGIAIFVGAAMALFAVVVAVSQHRAPAPRGYLGLEFALLSASASARTPMMRQGGAEIVAVSADSAADKAKIMPGTVVSAIDGKPIVSARQASDIVRTHAPGDRVILTVYDGEPKPRDIALVFEPVPPQVKSFSVRPPRILAKEVFYAPVAAANAAWSTRILRGPTIRPLALTGLGSGRCNGFAPQGWRVAGHAGDNSMFHVMAEEGFEHAIFQTSVLYEAPQDFVRVLLEKTFAAPATLTPPQTLANGFVLQDFGNRRGGAGFVLYRVAGNRIALWLAAVPGGDAGWAKPLVGAVVLSLRCAAPGAPAPVPRDRSLLATRVSLKCLRGACEESDFAGSAYLPTLRFGYVHNAKGEMFLLRPSRDFWQNGAEGPGFYHQKGGENEQLYPGRIN